MMQPFAHEEGVEKHRAPAPPVKKSTLTILLVEDQELVGRVVRSALKAQGYELLSASSAEEALAVVAREDAVIDLLITDVVLAGSLGTALAARLQESGRVRQTLFTSGYDRDQLPLAENANFLAKPFTLQELTNAVDGLFSEEPS